jgi:hypothetical protein
MNTDTSKEERLYKVTQGAGLKSDALASPSKDKGNPLLLGDFETQDACMHSRAFVQLKQSTRCILISDT